MRLGMDMSMLAFKRLVDRVVLIASDTDFAPAVELACREGLIVTVDPVPSKDVLIKQDKDKPNSLYKNADQIVSIDFGDFAQTESHESFKRIRHIKKPLP